MRTSNYYHVYQVFEDLITCMVKSIYEYNSLTILKKSMGGNLHITWVSKIFRTLVYSNPYTACLDGLNHVRLQHNEGIWCINYHCKVAGSNLTCRDDRISRWRLHSIGPTSTGLSLLGQNIIHSLVARVVYG